MNKWINKLSLGATVLTLGIIALGAFVRLQDAGLGCPDWPTCYGHLLWPQTESEQYIANQNFSYTPVDNSKTWPEQVHRLFASSLGFLSLAIVALMLFSSKDTAGKIISIASVALMLILLLVRLFFMTFWNYDNNAIYDQFDTIIAACSASVMLFLLISYRQTKDKKLALTTLIAVMIIVQGLFGMWTVTLKLWPQIVTLHLTGGMLIAVLFFCLFLKTSYTTFKVSQIQNGQLIKLKPLAAICLILITGQIMLGGWVSANYAAIACPDFPTCQWQWWPTANFSHGFDVMQTIGPNYLGGRMDNAARTAIHFTHRLGAITVCLFFIGLYIKLWLINISQLRLCIWISGAFLIAQCCLGIANILFQFPVAIAVLHNLFAALLLLSMMAINYWIFSSTALTYRKNTHECIH